MIHEVGVQRHDPTAFPLGKTCTNYIGVWVGQGLLCRCADNLAYTGIRSADCPARSESLYQLGYPGIKLAVAVVKLLLVILVILSHLMKVGFLKMWGIFCLTEKLLGY